jgi:Protein tyrosine and serine/threonine kinase
MYNTTLLTDTASSAAVQTCTYCPVRATAATLLLLLLPQIAKSHQQRNIMNEKNILMACDHPFVLNLICTYNTNDELLMLTELLLGGELWSYIYEKVTAFH